MRSLRLATRKQAVLKVSSDEAVINVAASLDRNLKQQQAQRLQMLHKQLFAVGYLVRHGLALLGYDSMEGNLPQLLQMWSVHDDDLHKWLKD